MKRKVLGAIAAAGVFALTAGTAFAHHGLAKEFDMEARKTLKGKITKVYWQNPHIYYTLEVMEKGKPVQYNIESVPVAMARNAGLTAQKLRGGGQEVEVTIRPALKDPHLAWGTFLKFADGSVITFEGFKE
jgi:hypothetical protein